jgi:hypothetical protein
MIEKGIYKHIENGLKDVRLARTNPFDVVAKKFREMP